MKNNKGFMTIEASVIVPTVLICVFIVILGFIFVYERAYVLSEEYETIYTIPLKNVRENTVAEHLNSKDYTGPIIYGSIIAEGEYGKHMAGYDGSISIMGVRKITSKREIDVCVDRLRRWQLYDDLAKKSGH